MHDGIIIAFDQSQPASELRQRFGCPFKPAESGVIDSYDYWSAKKVLFELLETVDYSE